MKFKYHNHSDTPRIPSLYYGNCIRDFPYIEAWEIPFFLMFILLFIMGVKLILI